MTVQDIETALTKIRDIHGDLDKEKLKTLLVSALWNDSDIRDGMSIWDSVLTKKVDQKNVTTNSVDSISEQNKEELPHNLPILHVDTSHVTTIGSMVHSIQEDISSLLFSVSNAVKDNTKSITPLPSPAAENKVESKEMLTDIVPIQKEGVILQERTSDQVNKVKNMENVEPRTTITKEEELQKLLDEAKKQLAERPPVASLNVVTGAPVSQPLASPASPVIMYVRGEEGEKSGLQILVSVSILLLLVLVIIIAYMYNEGRLSP